MFAVDKERNVSRFVCKQMSRGARPCEDRHVLRQARAAPLRPAKLESKCFSGKQMRPRTSLLRLCYAAQPYRFIVQSARLCKRYFSRESRCRIDYSVALITNIISLWFIQITNRLTLNVEHANGISSVFLGK